MIAPNDIQLITESQLAIKWEDDHESFYSAQWLRQNCQCAGCVSELTRVRTLKPDSVPEDLTILDYRQVGNYAFQFTFGDRHQTGIYSFEHLRDLCTCQECKK